MSFDADLIVDRRRMRRKLTFWRVVTVFVVIVAVVGAGLAFSSRGAITGPRRGDRPGEHRRAHPRQPRRAPRRSSASPGRTSRR